MRGIFHIDLKLVGLPKNWVKLATDIDRQVDFRRMLLDLNGNKFPK